MADEIKKSEGDKSDFLGGLHFVEMIYLLLFIAAAAAFIIALINALLSGELTFFGYPLSKILEFIRKHILFFRILSLIIAAAAAIETFILTKKANAIWREEKAKLYPSDMEMASPDSKPAEDQMKKRWEKIVALSESQNSSDWRLGIIEADIILDELLEKLQLPGNTMGEKLKAVEESDFLTIEAAWEAHKARNNIAHQGNDFLLNQRETARIISLYESVFKEFEMI
jgi:hypothetical protein